MINIEKAIKKVLKQTVGDVPIFYDPARSKMLDHRKRRTTSCLRFGQESKHQRKLQIRKFRQKNRVFCHKAKRFTSENLDDLCVEPLKKNTEGWHTW